MILKYGTYAHANNEVWFSISKRAQHSPIGFSQHVNVTWTINGVLKGDSTSDLTSKMQALENAYSSDFKDLIFYDNDGTTELHHSLRNNQSIKGIQVKAFNWLSGNPGVWGSGTEYVNRRSYQIVVSADVLDSGSNLLEWHEGLQLVGDGGPKWVVMGALRGPVQIQEVQEITPYRVIQSGYAYGHLAPPTPPAPIWPFALHGDQKVEEILTPDLGVNVNTRYGIRWRYMFESATALTGGPTLGR